MSDPGRRTVAPITRWFGLAERVPTQARVIAAMVAGAAVVALTIAAANPGELGPRFGAIFIVFAIVVGPLVAALLVLRPWNGLVAWAAMMALLNVARLQWWIGPFQLTQSTLFVGALIAGTLLERGHVHWPRLAGSVAIGLCAAALVSLAASPSMSSGVTIVQHGVIEPVLVALLVVLARPTARQVASLGGGLVVGLSLASIYSVVRIGRVATTIAGLEAVRVQLAHFTFYNVGIYGDALAMTIPLAIAGLLSWRAIGLRRSVAIGLAVALAVLLGGLYLTFSKSAWLGTALAILVVFIARFRRRRELAALAVAGAIALSLVVPYPIYLLRAVHVELPATNPYVALVTKISGGRLSSWDVGSPDGEVSITERWRATVATGRMVIDHPLLGVGPGQFGDEYAGAYADPGATRKLGSPHDLLPEVASELGLPAALLLLAAFMAALFGAWRMARSTDPLLRTLGAGFGAALMVFLAVTATFGLDLYRDYRVMNSDVIMAGLLVGCCVAAGAIARAAPPSEAVRLSEAGPQSQAAPAAH